MPRFGQDRAGQIPLDMPQTLLIHTVSVYIKALMPRNHSTLHRRVNITLPPETLQLIDRVGKRANRSRFIDEAVRHYVATRGKANLKKRLKEGARRRADRDLALAEDWFDLEDEAWPRRKS